MYADKDHGGQRSQADRKQFLVSSMPQMNTLDGRGDGLRQDSGLQAAGNQGDGRRFEDGELSLADLRDMAAAAPEPTLQSGKQERIENLMNDYMFS